MVTGGGVVSGPGTSSCVSQDLHLPIRCSRPTCSEPTGIQSRVSRTWLRIRIPRNMLKCSFGGPDPDPQNQNCQGWGQEFVY